LDDAPHQTLETSPLYRLFGRFGQVLGICLGISLTLLPGSAEAAQKRILAFGDSLTAGPGLAAEDTLPAQLEKRLAADGFDAKVINGGVSGDTTAMGLARLDYALSGDRMDIAIIELGANDMLRGLPPEEPRANLSKMIESFQSKGVTVILAAMVSIKNWGQAYRQDFDSVYPDLAAKYGVTMVPFFMEGVWGEPKLLLPDGLHPNAAGVVKIVTKIAPYVEKTLAPSDAKKESRSQ
jgi:acyl-CoA thioesterase-1